MKHFKKFFSLLLALALVIGISFMPMSNVVMAEGEDAVALTIVHTNDTHGRIKEGKYDGMGFAKIATKVEAIRAENPNVLVLDAGDTFHGQPIITLVEGKGVVDVMNTIGYDAMTAGNHDFNYGQDRLVELAELADFPIVSANVVKEDDTTLLEAYTIKEIGGLKVGIFGLASPETTYKTHPKNVEGLTFENPVEVAQEMVTDLEGQVDIIVALSHLGLDASSEYTSELVAQEVDGIDLIVDGHSHSTLEEGKLVNGALIVQAGEYDKNLGIVQLQYQDGAITEMTASLFTKEEAADLEDSQVILDVITAIEEENSVITSVAVGSTDIKLDGERGNVRTGETNLGNLITDAMIEVTGADVAITNGGGIRASIEPGEIIMNDVINVLPFGNYVVVKEIKGSDILAALEHGIDAYPETKGAFPHVGGMTFTFDPSKEAGSRLIEVKVGGEILNPDKVYTLATNDFMAAGGDDYTMFADESIVGEYDGLDEILADYIAEHGTDDAKVDGRVKAMEIEGPTTVYVVVSGDVLWRIAKEYGFEWEYLAEFNELDNPHLIFPGQEILIPAS